MRYKIETSEPVVVVERALEILEGDNTYIGTWEIRGQRASVFHNKNPDKSKGHKEYPYIYHVYIPNLVDDNFTRHTLIAALDENEMAEACKQPAVLCLKCDTVIWSAWRHDYHYCPCGNAMADGGTAYLRCSIDAVEIGTLNHLTGEFILTTDKDEDKEQEQI